MKAYLISTLPCNPQVAVSSAFTSRLSFLLQGLWIVFAPIFTKEIQIIYSQSLLLISSSFPLPKGGFPLQLLLLDELCDLDHLKYHFLIVFPQILIRCELHSFLKIATRSYCFMVCNSAKKSHVCVLQQKFGTDHISLTVWRIKGKREREGGMQD